jgi:hypothetical protein
MYRTQDLQPQQRGCVILELLGCDSEIGTQECGALLGDERLAGVVSGIATMYPPDIRWAKWVGELVQ